MHQNLPDHQVTRRFFLRASSATLIGASLFPTLPMLGGSWRFFTPAEAETVSALCERIIPADQDPGAAWAGVVHYIDRKLAGYYRRYQKLYRLGIQGVAESAKIQFGKSFMELNGDQQDELLRKLESNQAPGEVWKQISSAEFFNLVVEHTLQGFYGGPRHGGNRDAASWRMLDLPTAPVRSRRPTTATWSLPKATPPEQP
jgi:gluconate 2-dehydrogenase gamma chain